jgi:hypothetical protein
MENGKWKMGIRNSEKLKFQRAKRSSMHNGEF